MSEPIGKDCKHCDHLTACWEHIAGEHKIWQCCHCGRISGEYAPISRGFGAVWETGEHGPFLSQPRFAELKTGTPACDKHLDRTDDRAELSSELDEAITLLRAVAWCDCEIGALAVGVQQWLERRGIQWANDAGTSKEWRRVVEKQTVEHDEVTRLCPGGPER